MNPCADATSAAIQPAPVGEIRHESIPTDGPTLHGLHLPALHGVADLVLLHGYGDHAMRYAHALRAWAARGINAHALDLRGHGVSSGRRGFVWRWEEYLEDMGALLARPPLRDSALPLFVLGHSHGGLVAVAGALHGTFRADGLILSAPYLRAAHPVSWPKRLLAHLANPILPALRVGTGLKSDSMTRDGQMREEARHDTLLLRRATPRWFLTMRKVQQQVRARAGELKMPLLLVQGTDDHVSDLAASQQLLADATSRDKTELLYAGGKHELLRDLPRQQVIDQIGDWILART